MSNRQPMFSGELAIPSNSLAMSEPLKLPRILFCRSCWELWLIFLSNVVLASKQWFWLGVTRQTMKGRSSYFRRLDRDNTVFPKLRLAEELKRIAKPGQ